MADDYTRALQTLMQQAGFSSFRALRQAAGISETQLLALRRGKAAQLRLETLLKLSHILPASLPDLLATFLPTPPIAAPSPTPLQQEYDRLQQQLATQQATLEQEFQRSSVQILESLLLQLPTAAYAAQNNPQLPAVKLLPLLRPIDQLLQAWGIRAIGAVGEQIPYDPQQHQLMDGVAQPGAIVRVRYVGYQQDDRVLYRAKVSPVVPEGR